VVGPQALATARRVGPTAFTVLVALALRAEAEQGATPASVRSLAMELGLNKDTVAKALVRLRGAGLVVSNAVRCQSGYRLRIPLDVVAVTGEATTPHSAPVLRVPVTTGRQLSLLEAD
jgi:hypothetical protein